MKTISYNFEIKDSDKEDEKLKDSSKLNYEASFGKLILDLVKDGKTIKLSDFTTKEADVDFKESVEVEDPETNETKLLTDIVKKPCYVCSIKIHILRNTIKGKSKCTATQEMTVSLDDNKIKVTDTDKKELTN